MRQLSFIFLMMGAFILTSCGAVSVSSDYDRSANFNTYKTYTFHQKGLDKLKVNDLDKRRLISAIEQEMANKGLVKVQSDADLVVNVLTSSSQEVIVNNDRFGGYGYGYWGGMYPTVSDYTSGKIILDIVDDKRNILVWQGIGNGLNVDNISAKSEKIPQAVNEILKKFPPQPKK